MRYSIYVRRLERICKRWGGSFVFLSEPEFERAAKAKEFEAAPFGAGHGIDWWMKTVYIVPDLAHPNPIIHEMGHVFAEHDPPSLAEELNWLGWEICLARAVGCYRVWSAKNGNYGLGGICEGIYEWRDAKPAQRKRIIKDRLTEASALGLIGPRDEPLAIR